MEIPEEDNIKIDNKTFPSSNLKMKKSDFTAEFKKQPKVPSHDYNNISLKNSNEISKDFYSYYNIKNKGQEITQSDKEEFSEISQESPKSNSFLLKKLENMESKVDTIATEIIRLKQESIKKNEIISRIGKLKNKTPVKNPNLNSAKNSKDINARTRISKSLGKIKINSKIDSNDNSD